jgi:hypothetical protein
MAKVIEDLDDFVEYVNTLYNASSTPPVSGEEDYTVWTNLANIAVSIWENEEGMLWNELFVKLEDAADGDKATSSDESSYVVPSDFKFPASGYVWIDSEAYQVIKQSDVQLFEDDTNPWCYFLMDGTPTLEFNPNLSLPAGTLSYNYYKNANKLTTGASTFDMSDPMFAVYYVLAELKKEEGNSGELTLASQKLTAMKTRNDMIAWNQPDTLLDSGSGFGT